MEESTDVQGTNDAIISLLSEISTYVTWFVSRDQSERLTGLNRASDGLFSFSFHDAEVYNKR